MKITRLLSDKTKISHYFRLKNNILPLLSKKKEIVFLHSRKTLKHNYQNKLLICALVLLFAFHLSAQEKRIYSFRTFAYRIRPDGRAFYQFPPRGTCHAQKQYAQVRFQSGFHSARIQNLASRLTYCDGRNHVSSRYRRATGSPNALEGNPQRLSY